MKVITLTWCLHNIRVCSLQTMTFEIPASTIVNHASWKSKLNKCNGSGTYKILKRHRLGVSLVNSFAVIQDDVVRSSFILFIVHSSESIF
jgi:hypothetical protein